MRPTFELENDGLNPSQSEEKLEITVDANAPTIQAACINDQDDLTEINTESLFSSSTGTFHLSLKYMVIFITL